jgi:hypothetical protein
MQINQNEIQRPTLITPFFDQELTPDNEYLTYIDTSNDCISVTPTSNNSKNQLLYEDACWLYRLQEDSYFLNVHSLFKVEDDDISQICEEIFSASSFHIFKPQSHNCIQSLI